jgi:uncharacterized protein YkwD/rubrerythrin
MYSAKVKVEYGQTEARTILSMINEMRQSSDAWYWNSDNSSKVTCSGLNALAYDYTLEKIAMQRAAECAVSYAHERPNGKSWFSAYDEFNYSPDSYGENIAAGYSTAESVNNGWREDDEYFEGQGHRRNMLNGSYNAVGIGHAVFNGVHFWVEEFAKSGTIDSSETSANDETEDVNVNIKSSKIEDVSIVVQPDEVNAKYKKEIDLPAISAALNVKDNWPAFPFEVSDFEKTVSIEDTNIASLNGAKIYGNNIGDTKLNISAFGKDVSFDLNVSCEHEYKETSYIEPSCTEDGSKTFVCEICGESYDQNIEKLGHDMAHNEKIDADCIKKGQKEYWHCRRCEKDFFDSLGETEISDSEELVIPLTDHNFVLDEKLSVKATCTSSGNNVYVCSVCGEQKEEFVDILGHDMVYHAGVDPTCTSNGTLEHWHCQRCGKDFLDQSGNTFIDKEDTVLGKLDHMHQSFGKTVSATCFYAGSIAGEKCTVCGKIFKKSSVIPKLAFGNIKLKKGKNSFTASWKKVSKAKGYQIKYSLKKSFKKAKSKTLKGKKLTVSKLKSKKTYYVKVRAFTKINGKKVYSGWSKVRKVKVK